MPRVMDAHKLLEEAWGYLCDVENDVQKAIDCDHRDLLPNLHGAGVLYSQNAAAPTTYAGEVVVTPVMQFHTRHQLEQYLGEVAKMFIRELKLAKPKAIGNMWVACSVNPGRMCYELTLAIPFSRED